MSGAADFYKNGIQGIKDPPRCAMPDDTDHDAWIIMYGSRKDPTMRKLAATFTPSQEYRNHKMRKDRDIFIMSTRRLNLIDGEGYSEK